MLASERLSTTGPRLVFIHGFTQTRESWRPVAKGFAHDHEVILLDAPHHGASHAVDVTLSEAAHLIAAAVNGGVCIGYSMGGRMALHAALEHPESIGALVLVSATPGIDDPDERAARRDADALLANDLEQMGTDAFLKTWLAQPMFRHLRPNPDDIAARRMNPAGALAQSLRTCGTGSQESLWSRLASLTMPVLLVSGEDDHKFTDIACRMHAALPQARLEIVEGAGHSPHLEQPRTFTDLVAEWLAEIGR
jgi:2-succinyl-6-hydroxy-2,4-cyclohexadiene-1-carboxylate synthase